MEGAPIANSAVQARSLRGDSDFYFVVCTRKEVIGPIRVCDTPFSGRIPPKKLSDFLNMSSVLPAELCSARSQLLPCGVLDLSQGESVEFD
jgi:hypothetical protein